jgi:uncharacterized protein YndB with AHSA1/START domain
MRSFPEMIRKSILLSCPPREAFHIFTARISEWWPETHRLTKDPESHVFLEPGGRFAERARDGREMDLGRVLIWEPPNRLTLDFYMGTSAAQPTAVEVTFTPENGGTRVEIEHRSRPESEDLWHLRAPVFQRSWEAVLSALANR